MSLGVLNNISAMYAESNLNKTNNSLTTVLQQLSSGSKINSGADDAAGLSLVNGLAANSAALAQSQTNATEGVGLLQVADGALSQVTNLLNRAVTLATEVSNGTLNSSQQSAANQEYQSILSEINNIGSTTTYNQNKVFGTQVNIVTGDSSAQSASQDSLYFAGLSSSTVGDTGGSMSYSTGGGAWLNLSNGTGAIATSGDTLATGTTVTFEAWDTKAGANETQTITTTAGETVSQLVNTINTGGYGVTASFTTNNAANGVTGAAGLETGIQITGAGAEAGTTPTSTNGDVEVGSTTYDISAGGGNQAATSGSANITAANTMATISYNHTGDTNVNLSTSSLSSQANAEAALTLLNTAIADVASQDGYIGAQINTLNSVSNVISTQQQNVVSAQNAVQATDYASAASNMSKYEILSQTGISALAQANSVQQEVTKLLQ